MMRLDFSNDFATQEDALERAETRGRGLRVALAILASRVAAPDHVFHDALRVMLGFDPTSIERRPGGFSQLGESLEGIE